MLKELLGSLLIVDATISLLAPELLHNLFFDFFRVLRLIIGIMLIFLDEVSDLKKYN